VGIWSKFSNLLRKKDIDGSGFSSGSIGGWNYPTSTGIPIGQTNALQASAVMSCVSILAEDVAKMPWHVMRPLSSGAREIATGHPIELLLQRPNGWQTAFEFKEFMQTALLLHGNAYAVILRDGRGRPSALVPINPDRVAVYSAPDGELFYWVSRSGMHEIAILRDMPQKIPAADILHVRWVSLDSIVGLSRIGLSREAIALSLAQEQMSSAIAGNGARPGGVLHTDKKLSNDAFERLKVDWQSNRTGLPNAGKTVILEEGLKWQAMGMTMADAEFLDQRRFQVEEIARIFRVPMHKLGMASRTPGGSLTQLDQDYMNNVISSYVERWEAKIGLSLGVIEEGLTIEFDISRFLRADITARYAAYRTGIVGTFLTPNEVRRAEGLGDVEGGDVLLQPVNMAPLGTLFAAGAGGPGSDLTGAPAAGGDGDPSAVPPADGSDEIPAD
jgi:HK97 family phage portal protein